MGACDPTEPRSVAWYKRNLDASLQAGVNLGRILARFEREEPWLDIWRRYPHLTDEEHEATDAYACKSVSEALAKFLRAEGMPVGLVHARDALHPMHDEHYWVRVFGSVNVDYTANQFHNLEHPPAAEHADLPWPLVWNGMQSHPVSGNYGVVEIL